MGDYAWTAMLLTLVRKKVVTHSSLIGGLAVFSVVCGWLALAQPLKERPSFEVASVKTMLVDDPKSDFVPRRSGDRNIFHSAQLRTIISWAYHLTNDEYPVCSGAN
jgi:hypothetical protein